MLLLLLLLQQADAVDGYLAELKNSSKERQEMARLALRAHGAAVADRLKAAGYEGDFALRQGPSDKDPEILEKVRSIRITIDIQNAPLSAIADQFRTITGLPIEVDRRLTVDDEMISFKVSDIVLEGALQLLLHPRGCKFIVSGGRILLTRRDGPEEIPARWPVRVVTDYPGARRLVGELGADGPDDRDRAGAALLRLGLAAEKALWEGLDSAEAETRSRASAILQRLYALDAPSITDSPLFKKLAAKKALINLQKAGAADSFRMLSETLEVPVVLHTRKPLPDWTLTWREKQTGFGLLIGVARQYQFQFVLMDDWILITRDPERILGTTEFGSTWTLPEEARKIEDVLRRLTGENPAKQEEARADLLQLKPTALGPLLEASRLLPPAAAARCLEARYGYVDEHKLWLADEPSGALLQSLTDDQKRFLDEPVDLIAVDERLEEVLKGAKIPATVRSGGDLKVQVWAKGMARGKLLRALTGPLGLDFRLDGPTVVVDTAPRLRDMIK